MTPRVTFECSSAEMVSNRCWKTRTMRPAWGPRDTHSRNELGRTAKLRVALAGYAAADMKGCQVTPQAVLAALYV